MPPFCGTAGGVGRGSILSQATDKIPTYVIGLDDRLSGGIPRGHIVLVAGPPGSLKSSFVYRILFYEAKEHGASGLYLSMEQSRASLVAQMTSLGMDPGYAKGVHIIDVRALRREIEEVREQPRWLLGLRRQLARYKEDMGCDLIALDSLDALYALAPFESPRNEIFQIFEELGDLNATTFLVSAIPLVALLVSAFLGAYVFGVNPRGSANRSVLLVMLAFVLWDLGEIVERSLAVGTSADVLLFWARFTWVAIALVHATLYHLALTYPTKSERIRRPWALAAIYAPFVFWAYLIVGTGLIIDGVSSNAFGPSARVSSAYPYFAPVFGLWMFTGVALFVRSYWRVRKGPSQRMIGVVLGGLLLGTVPAAVTELLWPLLSASDTRVGLGSLYTLVWSIFIAYAVARYRYLVIEPVTELHTARAPRHRLERGLNYLVLENGRSAAMGAFRDIVSATPGLCVTGLAPSRVTVRFGLERTPILWITTVTNGGRTVRPNALDFELVHTVVKFLRENPGTAVLLDDLDFLATLAGFDAVARFLKRVTNQASASKGTVIIAAGLGTFPPDQLALLRRSVDRVLEVQ